MGRIIIALGGSSVEGDFSPMPVPFNPWNPLSSPRALGHSSIRDVLAVLETGSSGPVNPDCSSLLAGDRSKLLGQDLYQAAVRYEHAVEKAIRKN